MEVSALLSAGYKVCVLDKAQRPEDLDASVEYIRGNILDFDACSTGVAETMGVVHLAAMSRSGPSIEAWEDCLNSNIIGTANILKATQLANVSKFVYAASSTYYGQNRAPNRVDDKPDFLNFYSVSRAPEKIWHFNLTSILVSM